MSQATYRQILKAIALGDGEAANRLNSQLDEAGHQELFGYATAVLSVCLEQRFKDDSSPEAIRQFVEQMRHDFRNAEPPIKPLMLEALIRAFAGEEHLLEEIPVDEQANAQYPIIRKIVAESDELRNRLDDVLNDAEVLVRQWAE